MSTVDPVVETPSRSCAVGSQEGAEAEAGRSEQRAPADASPQRNPCWTAAVPVDDEQQDRGHGAIRQATSEHCMRNSMQMNPGGRYDQAKFNVYSLYLYPHVGAATHG